MDRICALISFFAAMLSGAAAVRAEVVVEYFDEPGVELYRQRLAAHAGVKAAPAARDRLVRKENEPSDGTWFVPFYKVDAEASGFGSSTFFSLRNEGDVVTNVLVEYFEPTFTPPRLFAQRYALIPRQIVSINAREALDDLEVDPDGFARGFIRIIPRLDEPISVDVFQVDAENDFAAGGPAFVAPEDFCTFWQVRFLRFSGTTGGSVLAVFVNGPRGLGTGNPPTLVVDLYNQAGAFVRRADVRTDRWAFEVDLAALAGNAASFGSAELILNATTLPGGVVSVIHGALGRFSVGQEGVCLDRV